MNNIILIGFMGSGKTTLGNGLAENLKYSFIDCDVYLEEKAQLTISEIFKQSGEKYFRQLEHRCAGEISKLENHVVSTGGGIIENPDNMKFFEDDFVIYIKAEPEKIYNNTLERTNRPLLDSGDRVKTIETLLAKRQPLYEKYANLIFENNYDDSVTALKNLMDKLPNTNF